MDALTRDVRIAVRSLRNNPGFTATAALTLGLGIGAVTAAASIVESLLLRPLPYPDTGRIVVLWERPPTGPVRTQVSPPNYGARRPSIRCSRSVRTEGKPS
ncbi:MAG TPA: hypothetical protein VMT87_14295 [Vicinamibacteria bacterium]|nr:hypothetical protein [Vicinamibacteria bacterium]